MGDWVKLRAGDGHELQAYRSEAAGEVKGSVVVVQEIFGVNPHVRSVADRLAAAGYTCLAPALFDRIEPHVELGYEGEDMQRAVGYMHQLEPKSALLDVAAAAKHLGGETTPVGVVGFCYGGFMSWLSATRGPGVGMTPACCVAYYPGGIGKVATEEPVCPVMIHIGTADSHIGSDQIDAVREAHPEVTIFTYEGAEHGFNCDARASYDAPAAGLAWERTLQFLEQNVKA